MINKLLNGLIKIMILINTSSKDETSKSIQLDSPITFKRRDKSIFNTAKYKTHMPIKIVMTCEKVKGLIIVNTPNSKDNMPYTKWNLKRG